MLLVLILVLFFLVYLIALEAGVVTCIVFGLLAWPVATIRASVAVERH